MNNIQAVTFLIKTTGKGYAAFHKDFGLSAEAKTKHDAIMLHMNKINAEILSMNIHGVHAHIMYKFGA